MDAVQISLWQKRRSKFLTFNFRFIEALPGNDKAKPKLFDVVVDVTPREFKEQFGRVTVTEYCITLRELKKGWWKTGTPLFFFFFFFLDAKLRV